MENKTYAGFWVRTGATLIDILLLLIITVPLLLFIYGGNYWTSETMVQGTWDIILNYVFPAIATILFWVYKSATPGKMATKLTIVDAKTGGKPTVGQFIARYIGYIVSMIPLFLGIIWVGIDARKQGWHDKLAGTVVVKDKSDAPVRFDS